MEKTYKVTWEIDLDATSPLAAAKLALQYINDPKSIAHIFAVKDDKKKIIKIDLDNLN